MFDKIVIFIVFFLLFFGIGMFFKKVFLEEKNVEITINNPYILDGSLDVRCDWDGNKRKYGFKSFVYIKSKHSSSVRIPNSVKKCQIWPKIRW